MTYPNAYKGVKNILTSISLTIFWAVGIVLLPVALALSEAVSPFFLLIAIPILVLMVVSFILYIVGLSRAGRDEHLFRVALVFFFLSMAAQTLLFVLGNFLKLDFMTRVDGLPQACIEVLELLTPLMVIGGIGSLAAKIGNENVSRKVRTFRTLVALTYFLLIAAYVVLFLFGKTSTTENFSLFCSVIAAVLDVVTSDFYLVILVKAKKMLASA